MPRIDGIDIHRPTVLSASCGNFSTSSTIFVDVTNLSVVYKASGQKRVKIELVPDTSGNQSLLFSARTAAGTSMHILCLNGATEVGRHEIGISTIGLSEVDIEYPSGAVQFIDTAPAAGNNTYKIQMRADGSAADNGGISFARLAVYEID